MKKKEIIVNLFEADDFTADAYNDLIYDIRDQLAEDEMGGEFELKFALLGNKNKTLTLKRDDFYIIKNDNVVVKDLNYGTYKGAITYQGFLASLRKEPFDLMVVAFFISEAARFEVVRKACAKMISEGELFHFDHFESLVKSWHKACSDITNGIGNVAPSKESIFYRTRESGLKPRLLIPIPEKVSKEYMPKDFKV